MHWTYTPFAKDADLDLEQGDLLAPTPELQAILGDVHPHFCANKYLGFAVTTQSCDLVRRGASEDTKARYINIATVRALSAVLPKLLLSQISPLIDGVFRRSDRHEAKRLLSRILDQNEQALGLFYFHKDAELELGEPAVAFLRVSVALHAKHYPVLVGARRGRLAPAFRAKFGWLVGNLYSRAATPDWSDQEGGKAAKEVLMTDMLRSVEDVGSTIWMDDTLADHAKEIGINLAKFERSTLINELEKIRPPALIDQAVSEVLNVLGELGINDDETLRKARHRLSQNVKLRELFRRAARQK